MGTRLQVVPEALRRCGGELPTLLQQVLLQRVLLALELPEPILFLLPAFLLQGGVELGFELEADQEALDGCLDVLRCVVVCEEGEWTGRWRTSVEMSSGGMGQGESTFSSGRRAPACEREARV